MYEKTSKWLTCFEIGHPKRIGCLPPPPPPLSPNFLDYRHPYVYTCICIWHHMCIFIYVYISSTHIYIYVDVKIHVYSLRKSSFEICFMHLLKRPYRCIKKRQYIRRRLNFTHNSIDYENAFEKETRRNNTFVFSILGISERCALDKRMYKFLKYSESQCYV